MRGRYSRAEKFTPEELSAMGRRAAKARWSNRMPKIAGPRLQKVTLNLYEADCETLEKHYGWGWSTEIRDVINAHAELIRKSTPRRKTLGELDVNK